MSDRETPADGEELEGWRIRWSSRTKPWFAPQRDPANPVDWDRRLVVLRQPVLLLTKPGRKFVEVKGESEIDRPVMLAHGMVSANLCDAHFARQWGDEAAALRFEAYAERWRQIVKVRTVAVAVARVNGRAARLAVGPADAGARGD